MSDIHELELILVLDTKIPRKITLGLSLIYVFLPKKHALMILYQLNLGRDIGIKKACLIKNRLLFFMFMSSPEIALHKIEV